MLYIYIAFYSTLVDIGYYILIVGTTLSVFSKQPLPSLIGNTKHMNKEYSIQHVLNLNGVLTLSMIIYTPSQVNKQAP